eukprot:gene28088-6558_t
MEAILRRYRARSTQCLRSVPGTLQLPRDLCYMLQYAVVGIELRIRFCTPDIYLEEYRDLRFCRGLRVTFLYHGDDLSKLTTVCPQTARAMTPADQTAAVDAIISLAREDCTAMESRLTFSDGTEVKDAELLRFYSNWLNPCASLLASSTSVYLKTKSDLIDFEVRGETFTFKKLEIL